MNPALQQDFAKLILRLALGILILLHGLAKLNGGLAGIVGLVEAQGLPGFLGYAVLIGEIIAPLMVLLGFHARIGGLLIAINMLVAVVLMHMGQLGSLNGQGGWALELQGMFFTVAVALALLGPGRFSVNGR
ncbi:GntR family transcriptional regulator [Lysobacter concretionis Ko07 = DSM 16239]|jgi:putative oxidoreductase|uniref:GntR family transcriptional regulator n=1 Tax=Lysobacter concretionis Ko07 = DSM 16239 TaxID=1122185 RepID=A0A0A0EQQ9_9GAMM|nr:MULTISPECIES: DoxX family protein [Lysobacter]KGM52560.1 GntR family transcriptional regulator [Lysobacter concretionis Ko07 = DSM 16239]QOD91686.1 DoxX family protein [Lysobacter sp. CW239]